MPAYAYVVVLMRRADVSQWFVHILAIALGGQTVTCSFLTTPVVLLGLKHRIRNDKFTVIYPQPGWDPRSLILIWRGDFESRRAGLSPFSKGTTGLGNIHTVEMVMHRSWWDPWTLWEADVSIGNRRFSTSLLFYLRSSASEVQSSVIQ